MTQYNHWFLRARLKTRQLLLLVALAEEGNIHRAAQVLNMTQPAASKLLKEMEDSLGVSLFERLPRGMQATWYGESMIRHARVALSSLNHAYDEVQALKAGRLGQVNIGSITTPGLTLLPPTVVQVKKERPGMQISVEIDNSPQLLEKLHQGKLDIVIARLFAQSDKSGLRYEPLKEEPISAMVRPGHPLLELPELNLRDLLGASWIVPATGSVLRHRFDLMFQEEGLPSPMDLTESSALLFITRALAQSDMVAVLASDVVHYYAKHGLACELPILLHCDMDAFGIITSTERLLSPAAKITLTALKQMASELYGLSLQHLESEAY